MKRLTGKRYFCRHSGDSQACQLHFVSVEGFTPRDCAHFCAHSSRRRDAHRLSEFQFRWNHRKAQDIFPLVIAALVIGAAMPYPKLITSADTKPDTGPELSLEKEPF